ncbi:nmrA-like family protein [Beauveria bassiana ARSEF 2860]|uniref:NmrA-like family protein n=1 Tax=Beauveria bassiana (strain ARSEF 2860) TaxID=655819 RepID=J5K0Z1_BEAB2|nr:nmrA-like family protein [Beauveria bassiana ARSEF 2860]EJP70163.1 nmrA-like family protein [Beauveria bassiana ARSEF 2860]
MSYNRIAVYGHRGRFSSKILSALIASGAPITVLHRPGSDVSSLPSHVPKIEVNVLDEDALVAALQDIDIVLSLVGDEGIDRELGLVRAIPRTGVKLFVPSDLGLQYDQEALAIPILQKKANVLEAARQANIPFTVILIANFAEFTLGSIVMGVDVEGNRLLYTGNAATEKASMCEYTAHLTHNASSTVNYVAAAYVSIFTTNPVSEISNRAIGLVELAPTGQEIAAALEKRHGRKPDIFTQSTEQVTAEFLARLDSDLSALAPAWYWRKLWGTGDLTRLLGSDIWHVPNVRKATLDDLIVKGEVGTYRDLSQVLPILEEAMFK